MFHYKAAISYSQSNKLKPALSSDAEAKSTKLPTSLIKNKQKGNIWPLSPAFGKQNNDSYRPSSRVYYISCS